APRRACTRGRTRPSGTGAARAEPRRRSRRTRDPSRAASSRAGRSDHARVQRIGRPGSGSIARAMEIAAASGPVEADVTAFAVLHPVAGLPDLDPRLAALAESGELEGTAGATCVLHTENGRIVAAGGGRRDQLDADSIRDAAAGVARLGFGGTVAWLLDDTLAVDLLDQTRAVVDGLVFGGYDPGAWKTATPRRKQTERLILLNADDDALEAAKPAERVAQGSG